MPRKMTQIWTDDELIILIYFASRGVSPQGIAKLIGEKFKTMRETKVIKPKWQYETFKQEHQQGASPMYNKIYNKTRNTWDVVWDLEVTDGWLIERIEAVARVWALKEDNDVGKAFRHYEKVIAKYTKLEQKEAVDFHIPQNAQAFIEANPVKVPDRMILEIEKGWYLKFLADQETRSPVPETETDQNSGESARQTTPSSGPETEMDHDLGELGSQTTPSPVPETETDELSGDVARFLQETDDWVLQCQHLPTLPDLE